MLLTRVARTPLPWARALMQWRVASAGETTAPVRTGVAFAFASHHELTSRIVTRRGFASAASSQAPPQTKQHKTKTKRPSNKHEVKEPTLSTSPRHRAAASDAWRKPFEAFEQRVHVHGAAAAYTAPEVYDIVKACVDNGRHREAQSVVRKARGIGLSPTPETQALMSAIHARKGNLDTAFDTLRDVLVAASPSDSKRSLVRLFDPLLSVLKDQNDWQSVRRAVQLLHEFQLEPPVRVFRVLLIAAAKARKKDVVLKTVAFVESKFQHGEPADLATLTAMCQALTTVGETRNVLDRYHTMDQDWLATNGTTVLFNNFVLAALRGGRITKALEIFDRMTVSDTFAPDDFTFATCILEFEKRGEWDHVIRFFNAMLEREMKGISQARAINALSCAAVVRALHNRSGDGEGERDRASDAKKRAIDRGMRVVLQRLDRVELLQFGHAASLVDALENHGFRAEAQRLFARMVKQKELIQTPWLRQDGFEVDLHSFSRGVAKCAVVFAFQHVRARAAIQKIDDVRVITGVGKRSKAYLQPVVPDDITELLVRSFRPLIRPMAHPTNPGVLLVRSKFIQQWLADGAEIRHFE